MAYLGRQGVTAPLTSADIPDNSITSAKIVDDSVTTVKILDDNVTAAKIPAGAVSSDVLYLENNTSTQDLSGTYSTERMYLNDSYQLTGDVTVTGHLALGSIADEDIVITNDGTERTITTDSSGGTLEAGNVLQDTHRTSLTDMTGELGSVVTGSPNLNLGNSSFPAGHVIQTNSMNSATHVSRSGDQSSWASTGFTCVLPNDLQSSSKLYASFSTQCGEDAGSWWAAITAFTIYNNSIDVSVANHVGTKQGLGGAGHPHSTDQQYSNRNVAGSVLFTPSGSGVTRRTVTLYWKNGTNQSHTSYLNRAHNDGGTFPYRLGSTTITLMEIAQ